MCSMTAQGSPLTRMRRAIRNHSLDLALSSAAEMSHVPLDDALELCLLLRSDRRYEAAARRWLARLAAEQQGIAVTDITAAAIALIALADPVAGPEPHTTTLRAIGRQR